jgi:hypothetical protein
MLKRTTFLSCLSRSSTLYRSSFNSAPLIHKRCYVDPPTSRDEFEIQKYYLDACMKQMKFTSLTHIQKKVIPKLFDGQDVLFGAETGSGKNHNNVSSYCIENVINCNNN